MEKKESRKPPVAPQDGADAKPKIPGLSSKAFGVIKFVLGICLLPFVYSVTVAFLEQADKLRETEANYFVAGMVTFLVLYLFIYEPQIFFQKGQRILEIIFSFFAPLVKVAPYLLPIYAILVFIAYLLLALVIKQKELLWYFMFFFGFSLALHLVFSAKSLRTKKEDFLKANYLFGFSFIYITTAILFVFCFNLIFADISVVDFLNNSFHIARNIFSAVFSQLFLKR